MRTKSMKHRRGMGTARTTLDVPEVHCEAAFIDRVLSPNEAEMSLELLQAHEEIPPIFQHNTKQSKPMPKHNKAKQIVAKQHRGLRGAEAHADSRCKVEILQMSD